MGIRGEGPLTGLGARVVRRVRNEMGVIVNNLMTEMEEEVIRRWGSSNKHRYLYIILHARANIDSNGLANIPIVLATSLMTPRLPDGDIWNLQLQISFATAIDILYKCFISVATNSTITPVYRYQ